jgi:hypothetical protein
MIFPFLNGLKSSLICVTLLFFNGLTPKNGLFMTGVVVVAFAAIGVSDFSLGEGTAEDVSDV